MKRQVIVILTVLFILALTSVFYITSKKISSLTGKGVSEKEVKSNLDDFAKCLTKKGDVLYIKEECQECVFQKRYFGSSVEYLNIVECAEQKEACEEKQAAEMPAWEINGKIYYGIKSLKELIEISECKF